MTIEQNETRTQAVCIRLHTNPIVEVTPYQLKGTIIRDFANHSIVPFINGEYREEYRYPRVQVKVLRNQLSLFGIGEGYSSVIDLAENLKTFTVDDITYEVTDREVLQSEMILDEPAEQFLRYKFITPWVALNRRSLAHYKTLMPRERITYLNRMLVQNLLFIAREMGSDPVFSVSARVKLQSLSPRVVEMQGSGSFKGYFTCNLVLPDYLGLGNGITKGLGTIVQLEP
jgi:hypothetical protein